MQSVLETAGVHIKRNSSTNVAQMLFAHMLSIVIALSQFSPSKDQVYSSQKMSALHLDFLNYEIFCKVKIKQKSIHLKSNTRNKTLKLQQIPSLYLPQIDRSGDIVNFLASSGSMFHFPLPRACTSALCPQLL